MSKSIAPRLTSLSTIIAAFLGDPDAAVQTVADGLHSAVVCVLVHGTRAPLETAIANVALLKGTTSKVRALREGFDTIAPALKRAMGKGTAGKAAPDAAHATADAIAQAFTDHAYTILTAPKDAPAKPDAAKVAARAFKALKGLSDAQIRRALRASDDAADFVATLARIAAEDAARVATDKARDAAGASVPGARRKVADKAPAPTSVAAPTMAPEAAPAGA